MYLMPRPGVLGLTPYPLGESSVPGVPRVIRLASNENALPPSPRALDAFRDAARGINRYSEPTAATLREKLAEGFGLDASRIVCGSGSGELIALLARAYAGRGDEVLCSEFGYLGFVKLTDQRLFSAFLHEAKPLKLHIAAISDLPRFRSETG